MRTLSNTLFAALGVLALCVPAARAQQQQTGREPRPTATGPESGYDADSGLSFAFRFSRRR